MEGYDDDYEERRREWMRQQEREREYERFKRQKIEEWEKKRKAEEMKNDKGRSSYRSRSRSASRSSSSRGRVDPQPTVTKPSVMSQKFHSSSNSTRLFKDPESTKIDMTKLRRIKVDIHRNIPGAEASTELRREILDPEDVKLKRRDGEGAKPIFEREELMKSEVPTPEVEEHRTVVALDYDRTDRGSQPTRKSSTAPTNSHKQHNPNSQRDSDSGSLSDETNGNGDNSADKVDAVSASSVINDSTRGAYDRRADSPTPSKPSGSQSLTVKRTASSCSRDHAERIDKSIVKMIANEMLPLSFVECKGFREMMAVSVPGYMVPCTETIKQRINLLYSLTKEKIKKELEMAHSVTAVSDCWTFRYCDSYLTISAHYLDNSWAPNRVCLATQEIEERHTAENVCSTISSIVKDYGMENKLTTIVTDNASHTVKSVELVEKIDLIIDVQCAAHTLHLAITDGLKQESIKSLCDKGGKMVAHFRHSNLASNALEKKQEQLGLKKLKLIQSCPTQWNSTFFMIASLIINRSAVEGVLSDRSVTNAATATKLEIHETEWKQLKDLGEVLKPLQLTTIVLCENASPISIVRPLIDALLNKHLKSVEGVEDGEINIIEDFKKIVQSGLKDRFKMIKDEEIFVSARQIASFLDPRYKDLSAEKFDVQSYIRDFIRDEVLSMESPSSDRKEPTRPSALDILFMEPSQSNSAIDEFEIYLAEPAINRNFNPFKWWSDHTVKYPKLAVLAKKYLAIPASSATSERVFSPAGNIVTLKRSCLHPDNVDKLVFLYQNRHLID